MRSLAIAALLITIRTFELSTANAQETANGGGIRYCDQGWSSDVRQQFCYTTQGSQLIPYDWFLALERPSTTERFASAANMERLRFISQAPSKDRNPDGLPIGFVVDDNPQTVNEPNIKRSFLGPEFKADKPIQLTNRWLGLTCAACHTGSIEYGKTVLRIDGGPAMADVQKFLVELSEAVSGTLGNNVAFERFARSVLERAGTGDTPAERAVLRERVNSYVPALTRLVRRGTGKHPYGFARLDAFGAILNEICDTSLGIPANYYPSDAPASFPFLWGTPKLDWVQWNGSAANPLARNIGQVLGVFGQVNLDPDPAEDRFKSTAHFANLIRLEDWLNNLQAPAWPTEILGQLDPVRLAAGKTLFEKNCATCHALRDPQTNQYPLTAPNKFGARFVKTHMIKLAEIGTDPALALNFATRQVDGGSLQPAGGGKVPRPVILGLAVRGVIAKKVADHQPPLDPATLLRINGFRDEAAPPNLVAYKAGPLEGIWATAPYLHNGSVPNLYELLLPSNRRSKSFYVGSRQFDPKRVGFDLVQSEGAFEFKVENEHGTIPGNSNAGHEGHGPGQSLGYTETFENGAWREFSDEERCSLIEFIKSLGSVESIPSGEAAQIENIAELTVQQLRNRYANGKRVLRGVHAKDHGCVKAEFRVVEDLPKPFQVGIFAQPGRSYDAWVRFSNAATLVLPDDPLDQETGKRVPGSRGMSIKLLGVEGVPFVPSQAELAQDFLLVNHPVFAFANVEDYEALSKVLADPANKENARIFFNQQFAKGGDAAARAKKSAEIVARIQAPDVASGAYQPQPASPVDCRYFSAAPFRFGQDAVMKFSAVPVDPAAAKPNVEDPNYLRTALIKRFEMKEGAKPVVFKFQVQRRSMAGLNLPEDIENVCNEWPEKKYPFTTVATLTILPQDFDSAERRELCENLFFTPWNGVVEHRPLGGINRMRRAVYEASSGFRHQGQ